MSDTKVSVETTEVKPVPIVVQHHKGKLDQVPWQRLALSLIGIAIIYSMWERGTNHLYSLPPHAVGAFVTWSINALYGVTAMVVVFVTGKLIYDWKNSTATTLTQAAQQIFSQHEETITTRTVGGAKAFEE